MASGCASDAAVASVDCAAESSLQPVADAGKTGITNAAITACFRGLRDIARRTKRRACAGIENMKSNLTMHMNANKIAPKRRCGMMLGYRLAQTSLGVPSRVKRAAAIAGLVACCWMSLSTEALALDVRTATKKFNARPRAALAMKLASAHLAGGRVGEALNWAESAAACKDATPKVLRAVQRMRAEQKWRLNDMAFGLVKLNVTPAGGRVVIDDRVYRPVRGHYELWLKSGTHHLQIDLPDYKTVDRIITAARGEVRTVGVSMTITRPPQLRLDIDPPNAELWVDNQ